MCYTADAHYHICPWCSESFIAERFSRTEEKAHLNTKDGHAGEIDECPACSKPIAWVDGEAVKGVVAEEAAPVVEG